MNAIWTSGDDGDRYMIQCNECCRMWFSPPVTEAIERFGHDVAHEHTEKEMYKLIATVCTHVKEELIVIFQRKHSRHTAGP